MSEFRLAPEAEAELDNIWLHIAGESGSVDIANRIIDNIAERFWLLAQHPHIGRRRDHDWRSGLRSFAAEGYVIVYRIGENNDVVLVLHVLHGSRDIESHLDE